MQKIVFRDIRLSGDATTLRRIHGTLEARGIKSKEQLADLLVAVFDRNLLDRKDLASDLGYNISSVNRWIDGSTAPHPSLWPQIIQWIMNSIEEKLASGTRFPEALGAKPVNVVN